LSVLPVIAVGVANCCLWLQVVASAYGYKYKYKYKWRFSSLNHHNVGFFGLDPMSPTHTGLICVKIRGAEYLMPL